MQVMLHAYGLVIAALLKEMPSARETIKGLAESAPANALRLPYSDAQIEALQHILRQLA